MTSRPLSSLDIEQIIHEYVRLSEQQDEAQLDDDHGRYNKIYAKLDLIDKELRSRGMTARLALARLFDHKNLQVRVNAATDLLGVVPNEARPVLERIRQSRQGPQCLDAGMTLRNVDNGVFKPD